MPRFQLKDVEVSAISLVKQGANGKRIALLKSGDESKPELLHVDRLIKSGADDWSTLYCVVAEPGTVEGGGALAPPGTEDVWASEDEIAKAAHSFMANGGLINSEHQDVLLGEEFKAFGQLVENAVALDDITVPGTTEVIAKGSWYIGVEPTDAGKAMVDSGEITGVSLQGDCTRVATTEDEGGWLAKVSKHFGIQPRKTEVAKLADDFATRQARSEFVDELGPAMWALEDAIWGALYQYDGQVEPAGPVIERSCDQFKAWALGHVANLSAEDALAKATEALDRLAWSEHALPPTATVVAKNDPESKEDDEVATPDERLTAVEAGMTELTELVKSVATSVETVAKRIPEPEPKAPTPAELQEQLSGVMTSVQAIAKSVEKLGEGEGANPEDPDRTAVAKFDPEKPLAGILG